MANGVALNSLDPAVLARPRVAALTALTVTLAAVLILLHGTVASLWELWMDSSDYGHGLLLVPMIIYLLWERRDVLAGARIAPSVYGLPLTAALIGLWTVSSILGVLIGEQVALVLLLFSILYTMAGPGFLRVCALPMALLLLAVPLWTYLNPVLQANTATAATAMTRFIGIPIFNEGVYLTIPGGRFLVADVCSGLRYLLASLTLASLYAVLNLLSTRYRLLLFVSAFATSMIFNWVRVTIIVAAGHYLGMETSLVNKHLWMGWVLFILVAIVILGLGNLFQRLESARSMPATNDASAAAGDQGAFLSMGYALVSILGLWLGSALAAVDPLGPGSENPLDLKQLSIPGYRATADAGTVWRPRFKNTSADARILYSAGPSRVSLYLAYYHQQHQGAEVVNDSNALYDLKVWRRTSVKPLPESVVVVPGLNAEEFRIRRIQGTGERLIWRLYWVAGNYAGSGVEAKYNQIKSLFRGDRSAAGIVLSVPITGTPGQGREQMQKFLAAGLVPLDEYLSSLR